MTSSTCGLRDGLRYGLRDGLFRIDRRRDVLREARRLQVQVQMQVRHPFAVPKRHGRHRCGSDFRIPTSCFTAGPMAAHCDPCGTSLIPHISHIYPMLSGVDVVIGRPSPPEQSGMVPPSSIHPNNRIFSRAALTLASPCLLERTSNHRPRGTEPIHRSRRSHTIDNRTSNAINQPINPSINQPEPTPTPPTPTPPTPNETQLNPTQPNETKRNETPTIKSKNHGQAKRHRRRGTIPQ